MCVYKYDDDCMYIYVQDKGLINYSESEILEDNDDDEDKNVKGESERSRIECTELKKKGLCLVPLSMLVNYFG